VTAEERLAMVRLKIERANKHVGDLQTVVRNFLDSNPYEVATKRDPTTRKLIYYIARANPFPPDIAVIAGDVLHNLRCSLDHLAQQLYLVGSGSGSYRDQTSFLIAKGAKEFKAGLPGKVHGMRQDAIDAICALEPYDRGQGADLWTLHRLNNIDKHRLIVPVGSMFQSMDILATLRPMAESRFPKGLAFPQLFIRPADIRFPLKSGDELFIDSADAEPNQYVQFKFGIAFNEPGIIEGKPIMETLVQFSNRVSGIIEAFRPCLV